MDALLAVFVTLAFALLAIALHACVYTPYRYMRFYQRQGVPGSPWIPLLGDMPRFSKMRRTSDFFEALIRFTLAGGPVSYMFFGPELRLRVLDPRMCLEILGSQASAFEKPELMRRILGPTLGLQNLLLSEGRVHSTHRALISPAFQFVHLKGMTKTMSSAGSRVLDALARRCDAAPGGQLEVDMHPELSAITLDIIARCAFGDVSVAGEASTFHAAIQDMLTVAINGVYSFAVFIKHSERIPTPSNLRLAREAKAINVVLLRALDSRRRMRAAAAAKAVGSSTSQNEEEEVGEKLLIDLLLDASSMSGSAAESGGSGTKAALSDDEILSESMTFVMAGHETTSQALSWSMVLLASHPEWMERARLEVLSVVGAIREPVYDDLHSLPTVAAVLYEAMRLYPPAGMVVRTATQDLVLGAGLEDDEAPTSAMHEKGINTGGPRRRPGKGVGGDDTATTTTATPELYASTPVHVAAGTTVVIPIHSLHRHPQLWDRPNDFDPTRFLHGVSAAPAVKKHPAAYLPFSHGVRSCIGQQFALLEGRLILAQLLQRFEWTLAPSYVHWPQLSVTLRPKHGLPVLLRRVASKKE